MTDTYQQLLAAVIDSPADDLPRLIIADYLQERGGEGDEKRAMDIRRMVERPWEFREKVVTTPDANRFALTARRGFVDEVECAVDCWRAYGEQFVRQHPIARVILAGRSLVADGELYAEFRERWPAIEFLFPDDGVFLPARSSR